MLKEPINLMGKESENMGIISVLKERGLIAQITHEEELSVELDKESKTFYLGIDPTAPSLHIGHTVPLMAARWLQKHGHRIVLLVGGGTAKIGDPTGKSEMRKMLSEEELLTNIEGIKSQLGKIVDLSDPKKGVTVNNSDWLDKINYIDFLREYGACFSVNRMLTFENIKQRLEKGLSYLEFNYMILQAYDFLQLHNTHNCQLQIGGDDQWSNMLSGMELVRRKNGKQVYCFTVPLLVSSSGKKMGKTEKGAIWIDEKKTSPFELYQYFRNIEDSMVKTCLSFFTDLDISKIEKLSSLEGSQINEAKIELAFEACKLFHGLEKAEQSKQMAQNLFKESSKDREAPTVTISKKLLENPIGILDFLLESKIIPSKSEGRRLVQGGGISLDGKKITDISYNVELSKELESNGILVQKGKKHFFRVCLV